MEKKFYLINKTSFISEYEKFYSNHLHIKNDLGFIPLSIGKCNKFDICCNFNKEWFLYDNDSKQWLDIDPILLPSDIYERDKTLLMLNEQTVLNDIEDILIREGASEEMISDLFELIDILNNYINKDIRKNY